MDTPDRAAIEGILGEIAAVLPGLPTSALTVSGTGSLPSVYAVTPLATASVAAAGLSVAKMLGAGGPVPPVRVDRRLASMWFAWSLRPDGWTPPPPWDPIAGDYRCADGWIRLHTNAPHHRAAALKVLATAEDRQAVTEAAARWSGAALEQAVVEAGGCAARMLDADEWTNGLPGRSVRAEPLIAWDTVGSMPAADGRLDPARPLAGIRVLDLTRVLAGPVATRLLAMLGADVLRIDPPGWDEDGVIPEIMQGKRSARLALTRQADRRVFERLLSQADLLVHGYRNGALDGLGYGETRRSKINGALMEVALDAYGWTGPWKHRRGFDSLVQMSCGIAAAGMRRLGRDKPTPLPVQALDHATGYLMAAAAIAAITDRRKGVVRRARLSLARTAALLVNHPSTPQDGLAPESAADLDDLLENTSWGPARRLKAPLAIEGVALGSTLPAMALGSHAPEWA